MDDRECRECYIEHPPCPTELDTYNWHQAFGCAGERDSYIYDGAPCNVPPGENCDTASFSRWDVKRIIALSEGEHDGPNWLALVELKDGRFAFVDAGCDYTGWDCQAGGTATVCAILENLVRMGMHDEARERLGVSLQGGFGHEVVVVTQPVSV